MKLKYKFIVKNIAGQTVAIAVGQDNELFNGMVKLNAGGEVIFKMLAEGEISEKEILSRFAQHFEIPEDVAQPSVEKFLEALRENGFLTDANCV